jgi:hypothetical protein
VHQTRTAANAHGTRTVSAEAHANSIGTAELDSHAREVDTDLVGEDLSERRGMSHTEILGTYRGNDSTLRIDGNLCQRGRRATCHLDKSREPPTAKTSARD